MTTLLLIGGRETKIRPTSDLSLNPSGFGQGLGQGRPGQGLGVALAKALAKVPATDLPGQGNLGLRKDVYSSRLNVFERPLAFFFKASLRPFDSVLEAFYKPVERPFRRFLKPFEKTPWPK